MQDLKELLVSGAAEFNVNLTDDMVDNFFSYMSLLKEWNSKMNLTAIEEDRDVIIKHFTDSLSILPFVEDKELALVDIGTGAGFPGVPLKIVRPALSITLADSLQKRLIFLDEVIKSLKLRKISTVHGRAEDLGQDKNHREKYDIAVARAVAGLPVLLEYCLPFVRPGGIFIAMKGSDIKEVQDSKKALSILGGEIVEVKSINLPFTDNERNLIIVKKFRHTPTGYPRKAGKPSKNPLVEPV